MTHARLSVSLPDGSWKRDAAGRDRATAIRIESAATDESASVELVTVTGADAGAAVADLSEHPAVSDVNVLERGGDGVRAEVEAAPSPLHLATRTAGVPLPTPVTVADGDAVLDVTSTHDRLSRLGDALRSANLEFRVAFVQDRHESPELLTDTQRSLFDAAVEQGYYEAPRSCTLTELAEHVGLAKSTCSETLQRVHAAIAEYYLQNGPSTTGLTETTVPPTARSGDANGERASVASRPGN